MSIVCVCVWGKGGCFIGHHHTIIIASSVFKVCGCECACSVDAGMWAPARRVMTNGRQGAVGQVFWGIYSTRFFVSFLYDPYWLRPPADPTRLFPDYFIMVAVTLWPLISPCWRLDHQFIKGLGGRMKWRWRSQLSVWKVYVMVWADICASEGCYSKWI